MSGIWGLNVAKNGAAAILDRGRGIIVEYRIGEIRGGDAIPNAAEQWDRDLTRLAHVIVECRGEIGVMRVGEVDLHP